MRSDVPLMCGKRLHASVRCTQLVQQLHDCRSLWMKQILVSSRPWLRMYWPICIGHALWTLVRRCVCTGTSALPILWSGEELGLGLYACAADLSWHVLALSMQASVLQSRCGALTQSLHLLLCLVYCRDLQTQGDALVENPLRCSSCRVVCMSLMH